MEFLGEIRNDEIFISKDSCLAQCPAGPPGRPGRTAGDPGLKGSNGDSSTIDPGISSMPQKIITTEMTKSAMATASVTSATVDTATLMSSPRFTAMHQLRKDFIPRYSPVGNYRCVIRFYRFATSFFTRSEKLAKDACKRYYCDIIIEWTRRKGSQIITGWDIGNLGQKSEKCSHNPHMTAKVIWQAT